MVLGLLGLKGLWWVCRDTLLILDSHHWVVGEAVIDRSWLDKTWNKSSQNYSLMMTYHFSAGGVVYTGDRFEIPSRRSGGDEQYFLKKLAPYAPGSAVKILYDPKDPARSVVTPPYMDYFFIIVMGGGSLFLCIISSFTVYRFVRKKFLDGNRIKKYATV